MKFKNSCLKICRWCIGLTPVFQMKLIPQKQFRVRLGGPILKSYSSKWGLFRMRNLTQISVTKSISALSIIRLKYRMMTKRQYMPIHHMMTEIPGEGVPALQRCKNSLKTRDWKKNFTHVQLQRIIFLLLWISLWETTLYSKVTCIQLRKAFTWCCPRKRRLVFLAYILWRVTINIHHWKTQGHVLQISSFFKHGGHVKNQICGSSLKSALEW